MKLKASPYWAAALAVLAAGCGSAGSSTPAKPLTITADCSQSIALNAAPGTADCDLWPSQGVYVKTIRLEIMTARSGNLYVTEPVNREIPAADPQDQDGTTVMWVIPQLRDAEASESVNVSPVSFDSRDGGGIFVAGGN